MLLDTLHTKSLTVAPDSHYKLIIRDLELEALQQILARASRDSITLVSFNGDGLVGKVNIRSPSLVELCKTEFTTGLNSSTELERANSG